MFSDPVLRHIVVALIIILVSAALGNALKHLLNTVFRKMFERTKTTLDERLLEVIRSRVTALAIIAGFYIGVKEVRSGLTPEHVTHHQILDYIEIALFVVLIVVLTRLLARIIRSTFQWYMEEVSIKTHSDVASTVVPLTTKVVNLLLFLIAGMILLDHFGINIGSLLVSLGVGSLALALAAQETVANMIAGFVILVDQPFRVGDHIKLPSGDEGDIVQIGLRSTRMLNPDANLLILPNGELVKSRIINYSFPDASISVVVEVVVAFGTDVGKARAILLELAGEDPDVRKTPPPSVFVTGFADSGIKLQLGASTANFRKKFAIEAGLRESIYAAFAKRGIEIPVPQRVVQLTNAHEAQAPPKK